jgi:hypothetical protein
MLTISNGTGGRFSVGRVCQYLLHRELPPRGEWLFAGTVTSHAGAVPATATSMDRRQLATVTILGVTAALSLTLHQSSNPASER